VRYFDPVARRPGIPDDVAALVEKLTDDSLTLTLVNTNQLDARTVTLQAGGYAEHQFVSATVNGRTTPLNRDHFTIQLQPGSGARLEVAMQRYVNQPTLSQPWDRD
jgi:hypothetical protein